MNRKTASGMMFTLLLFSMLTSTLSIQPARAIGTIHIRPDGSIDPSTAPILRDGDLYTLTDNITSDTYGVVIERDNMVLDGAGYTLQGPGTGHFPWARGISAGYQNNITIRNMRITNFTDGISFSQSENCDITGNIMTKNGYGIYTAYTSNFVISGNIADESSVGFGLQDLLNSRVFGNTVTNNNHGIWLYSRCYDNVISGNIVNGNRYGISLGDASGNSVFENDIMNGLFGIDLAASSSNIIYHNNFVNNTNQAVISSYPTPTPPADDWNEGYPSGGNYWSDFADDDVYRGVGQDESGSDGIWDHPYVIDADNQDNYPLVEPWEVVPATIDFFPNTLNVYSLFGRWIKVYIELPEGYDVNDIDVTTVELNDEVQAALHPTDIGDYDRDGKPDLMVKFDRTDVMRSILRRAWESTLTITGTLIGKAFEGSETIRVIGG